MKESTKLLIIAAVFAACWHLPLESATFRGAVGEGLELVRWYAREHVLLCLVPALFIAGAIGVFVSQGSVMRYLGPRASKLIAYPVAASSGTVLAVCSCTVLPLFAGLHQRGAGIGPATAFLYSGPAINVLAIVMTWRVLGPELGLARAIGAVVFSVVIGVAMHLIFRRSEAARASGPDLAVPPPLTDRPPWQTVLFFAGLVGVLVIANLPAPDATGGPLSALYATRWYITGTLLALLGLALWRWFERDELGEWADSSWTFAKQILPLLLAGVLVAGFLLGGPDGGRGMLPAGWIESMVGGSSLWANLFASVAGAFMYFATLTEVPILEGLLNQGMGRGPALALLLAGPALSLPNMLVIRSVLGWARTAVYICLVVVLSTTAGVIYGAL